MSEVKMTRDELLEVDICDGGGCSEDESGVYLNSNSIYDDFSGFQQWSDPTNDTSAAEQEVSGERAAPPAPVTAARRRSAAGDSDSESDGLRSPRTSIVDCLLVELYDAYSGGGRRNVDSWDSSTEASGSDAFLGRSNCGSSFLQELQEKHTRRHQMSYLAQKGEGCLG